MNALVLKSSSNMIDLELWRKIMKKLANVENIIITILKILWPSGYDLLRFIE